MQRLLDHVTAAHGALVAGGVGATNTRANGRVRVTDIAVPGGLSKQCRYLRTRVAKREPSLAVAPAG